MSTITHVTTSDVRFPTSRHLDGSDAMNPDPDYSAAYVVVHTDIDRLAGHGFTFTIGRGNDIQRTAIESLAAMLTGRDLGAVLGNLGGVWDELVGDSQFRWLGPEKGVIHMAAGAILNALWDLRAMMFGSDWPVCELAATYEKVVATATALLSDLTQPERDAVLGGTARRVYGLAL